MRLQSIIGFIVLALLAWLLSERRGKVNFRTLFAGFGLQLGLGIVLLKFPGSQSAFLWLNRAVHALSLIHI